MITATTCISAFAGNKTLNNTSDSGVLYELTFESESPEAMKPLPVRIGLSGPDGTPISGARITCSLSMPAMAMARNAPTIKESSIAGQYESIFLITMGGLWDVELTTVYDTGRTEIVIIPFYGVNAESTGNGVDTKLEELFHENRTAN